MAVLIDNSTISSVQRALGLASISEPALLDVEHTSLGRFCEAVLFQDRILIPDNYKAELTAQRKKLLDYPIFEYLPVSEQEDQAFLEVANSLSSVWTEAFQAGTDSGLFSKYFSQVRAFSHFIWEHSSSDFFLVFRALGIDKESPLIEAVLASPGNEAAGRSLEILGTDGLPVGWEQLSRHVQRMLSVLGWLGNQYVWYQVLAANVGHAYLAHPLRDFFAHDFMRRVNLGASDAGAFSEIFNQGINRFAGTMADAIEELGRSAESATITVHSLLPLIIRECTNGKDFLPTLMQIRDQPDVVAMRQILIEVNEAMDNGDFGPARKLKDDIDAVGKNILVERGFERRHLTLTPPTTLLGISVSGDALALRCPLSAKLYKQFFIGRRYRTFIRRTLTELSVPGQLGELKDKLNGFAWIAGKQYPKFYLKEDHSPSKFHKIFDESAL